MNYPFWLVLLAFVIGFASGYGAGTNECRIEDHTTPEQTKEIYL